MCKENETEKAVKEEAKEPQANQDKEKMSREKLEEYCVRLEMGYAKAKMFPNLDRKYQDLTARINQLENANVLRTHRELKEAEKRTDGITISFVSIGAIVGTALIIGIEYLKRRK